MHARDVPPHSIEPVAATRAPAFGRLTRVGAALLVGLALLVLLWIGAVVDLAFRVRAATRQSEEMTGRFIATDDALQTIRTTVLLAAIDWRDAFLDADPVRSDVYQSQLLEHQRTCASRLAELRARGDEFDVDVSGLAREVEAYWADVIPLLELAPLRQAVETRRLLNERVLPKRTVVINIVQHVQQLNRSRFQQQQRDVAAIYTRAQSRLSITGGLATALSLVIGAVLFLHVSRLEGRLRAQLAANEAISADLHRLSARVVRAQEDERRQIARELHDEVGQALTAVKLHLSLAGRGADRTGRLDIEEARHIVDAALQSTRELSRLLHPPMLDDVGLAAAVQWYLRGFSSRTGIAVTFEHDNTEQRAAREIETCLYRVVQEATTNVARHAGATACRVYLQRLPASVVMTVEDDGRGFDPGARDGPRGDGLGLLGIRERVAGFRGTFSLDSAVGRGTRLTVELPALDEGLDDEGPSQAAGAQEESDDGADPARG